MDSHGAQQLALALESHAHAMRTLFEPGYGNAACMLAEQLGAGGIAERLATLLEQQVETATKLAEVTKQRDEFAKHIATRERNDVRDGACDLCFPNAPTKTGYVCIRHRAEAVVAGRRA